MPDQCQPEGRERKFRLNREGEQNMGLVGGERD